MKKYKGIFYQLISPSVRSMIQWQSVAVLGLDSRSASGMLQCLESAQSHILYYPGTSGSFAELGSGPGAGECYIKKGKKV